MNRNERRIAAKASSRNGAAGAFASSNARFSERLDLALKHHRAGRVDEAERLYREILSANPNDALAHNGLGVALKTKRDLKGAVESYQRAIVVAPDYIDAYYNLGLALQAQGKLPDARNYYERVLKLDPQFADAHIGLGTVLLEEGNHIGALAQAQMATKVFSGNEKTEFALGNLLAKCGARADAQLFLRRYLARDPEDRNGARLILAGMGLEPIPERAPQALLDRLYSQRAAYWDERTQHVQPYRGAALVAEAVAALTGYAGELDILDAGCGTGLVGALLRDRAHCLDGVDLSGAMLGKAKDKNLYDSLHLMDLVTFMASRLNAYDVVASAATLIHFGDLRTVFDAAAVALRDGGLFVFTLFPNDVEHDGQAVIPAKSNDLAYGGCFAHGPDYVSGLAGASGFSVNRLTRETHEYHRGQPVPGLLVALRKRER